MLTVAEFARLATQKIEDEAAAVKAAAYWTEEFDLWQFEDRIALALKVSA